MSYISFLFMVTEKKYVPVPTHQTMEPYMWCGGKSISALFTLRYQLHAMAALLPVLTG